jgi:hypothetical protein
MWVFVRRIWRSGLRASEATPTRDRPRGTLGRAGSGL